MTTESPSTYIPDSAWRQAVMEITDAGFGAAFRHLLTERAIMIATENRDIATANQEPDAWSISLARDLGLLDEHDYPHIGAEKAFATIVAHSRRRDAS